MTDISFLNFFGTCTDFEQLKKWLRINSELYKDLIVAAKERCDLESEYSSRLAKINAKILKSFIQSFGSVSTLWSKTAHLMNEEADAHKHLGSQINEEFYKPLINISEQFNKFKKPIENDIDKCSKLYQDKREDENRLKKKAFAATRESEKAYDSINEYKGNHQTSVAGNDKERSKIEKRAVQLRDISTKAEAEYFESSPLTEDFRHKWEQSYIMGLDKLQKLEMDRLGSMKTVIESYQRCISKIPVTYADIASNILKELGSVNFREDLMENCLHYTNKKPNIYKTEQLMLDFYAEMKENPMDLSRRLENLKKRISVLYQNQKKSDLLRAGAQKMLTVYEESPQFSDEVTRMKTSRELSRTQCLVNLLSANIYKLQKALNSFESKSEPPNPLIALGMKLVTTADRIGFPQSILESKPGMIVPFFEPGIISSSSSNSGSLSKGLSTYEDDDNFDTDSETEEPKVRPAVVPQVYQPSKAVLPRDRPVSQGTMNANTAVVRPLPSIPNEAWCQALHDFIGRDIEELSFNEGERIKVTNKLNEVWWEGELRGKTGLIPANYVKELL